ncbi:putative membrane protein [Moraxella catarrhalis]|uniref:Membrane protein n=1 Tax=Moraxella catarrhalis TaxID=480 RepID=A0ABY0BH65_MORCA|nr:putative membrane protein [Moraxella catarrhalis]
MVNNPKIAINTIIINAECHGFTVIVFIEILVTNYAIDY